MATSSDRTVSDTRLDVPAVTVFVCVSCRKGQDGDDANDRPGRELGDVLRERLAAVGVNAVTVTDMECLAVCKRPCTVALAGENCWSYVLGDIEPDAHADDLVGTILAYQRSGNGVVPWRERPVCFKKGVVARIPPRGFVQPRPEGT